ncbi:MAG: class I SAM-dependent methyltransferase [Gammaproteobacteria bacterium]|nr:class I SAM-dependent methyltransferase [Gammaproteobacteria bacterium]
MKFRHRCGPNKLTRKRLREWYSNRLGKTLQAVEREQLDEILSDMFGYFLVQVGYPHNDNLFASSRVATRFIIDIDDGEKDALSMRATAEELPIATDSIDVLLLPHTMEFVDDPHQVLREADRVLIPEGHIVILGFNPWGLWGLWRQILCRLGHPPWCGRFYRVTRLKDWLSLLGFETTEVRKFFHRPPVKSDGLLRKLGFMEKLGRIFWPWFSGVYILVAKKRVTTLIPTRSKLLRPDQLLPRRRAVEPSTRILRNDKHS